MQRILILVWPLACLSFTGHAASQPATLSEEGEQRKHSIEEQRLDLDRDRLNFDKQKYDPTLETLEAVTPIASVLATVGFAFLAYFIQLRIRRRDEALQFQLKAAEVFMAAPDANQAKRRAEFLSRLFPKRLGVLQTVLRDDGEDWPYFGRSIGSRKELLDLLAQHPESRAEIIRAWEILFPWNSTTSEWAKKPKEEKADYRWFDELKKEKNLNLSQQSASH